MVSDYLSRMINKLKLCEQKFSKTLAEETERLQKAEGEVAKNQAELEATQSHIRLLEAELKRITQAERGKA